MTDMQSAKPNGEIAATVMSILPGLDSADRAKIRRGQYCSAFWCVWSAAGLDDVQGPRAEAWEAVIKSMCCFIGTRSGDGNSFISKDRLGTNLARAGMKEMRFERLIMAPLEARRGLLDRAVQMMSRKVSAINIYDLCDLYLHEEPLRLRAISSSYYNSVS